MSQPTSVRIAVLDADTGFLQVLSKRLEGAGWQYRVLASPVPLDAIVAMRLNAVVIDLAVLGPQGWNYLEKLCTRLPGLGVVVCTDQFQAFVGGVSVDLTRREFELIQLLADAQGQVMQREEIYQRVWGYAMVHGDRSVDVFVRKLRQKLEKVSPGWRYIHTHFGIGYRFDAEPLDGPAVDVPDEAVVETAEPVH